MCTCIIRCNYRISVDGTIDSTFKWIGNAYAERDFLGYLDEWHASVQSRSGFTLAERKKMELSDETLSGLKLTGVYNY